MRAMGIRKILVTTFLAAALVIAAGTGALAQDKDFLIFAYNSGNGFDSIQWMNPDQVDSQQPLVTMPGTDLTCPRVSKDNVNMAFVDLLSGMIYVYQIGVTAPTPIGNSVPARSVAWSSDGTTLYFWGSDYVFYSIPAVGGATTPLFGGQTYWAWFNDGGFDVLGVLQNADEDGGNAGTYKDYILAGATTSNFGKVNLIQLEVQEAAVDPVGLFAGLADNYTPTRGPVDGRLVFQADHDGAGSHRVYTLNPDGTTTILTDLYSGSPFWNATQTMFAYAHAGASTFGSTAYAGAILIRHEADGSIVQQFTSGIGRTPAFYGELATAEE